MRLSLIVKIGKINVRKFFFFFFNFSLKTQNIGKYVLNITQEPPLVITFENILQISLVNEIKLSVDN